VPERAEPVQEQGDGHEDVEGPSLRESARGAGSQEGRSGQAEGGHRVREPDSLLRLPALHHGERSSNGAEGRRRAESDGWRPGPVHRGLSEATGGTSRVSTFVEAARREKLEELARRGIPAFAYRFARTGLAQAALAAFQPGDETAHRLAG